MKNWDNHYKTEAPGNPAKNFQASGIISQKRNFVFVGVIFA